MRPGGVWLLRRLYPAAMKKQIVVIECDLCGAEKASSHTVAVDRWRVTVDACEACWTDASETLDRIHQAGRRARDRRRKRPQPA